MTSAKTEQLTERLFFDELVECRHNFVVDEDAFFKKLVSQDDLFQVGVDLPPDQYCKTFFYPFCMFCDQSSQGFMIQKYKLLSCNVGFFQVRYDQCDQIWRNFSTLVKL